jgi:hypothetical protein
MVIVVLGYRLVYDTMMWNKKRMVGPREKFGILKDIKKQKIKNFRKFEFVLLLWLF